jgi:glutamine amidotransferase
LSTGRDDWSGTPLQRITPGESVYFVHSFMAAPADARDRIADCLRGGVPVSAAIGRQNIFGCQFHPEKSGEVGLNVLRGFLTL